MRVYLRKKTCSVLLLISSLACVVDSFIVPVNWPNLLSIVFSTVPKINKAHDSRVGLGFRLGDHADFQLLFEIGPQNFTQPLGPEEAQRRRHVKVDVPTQKRQTSNEVKEKPVLDSEGSSWLEIWRKSFSKS